MSDYSKPILPADYTTTASADYAMLYKIAYSIMRGVQAVDHLNGLDKGMISNGVSIENVVVPLASGTAYDATAVDVFTAKYPSLAVRYFKDWNRRLFETTINDSELRKCMLQNGNANSLAETIVASLTEGDRQERYEYTRDLMKWGKQDGTGKVLVNKGSVTNNDYKGILTKLKDIISGMQFVNADFNNANIKRKTLNEDIMILMPYTIKNKIDVNELSGVFNLDKAELKSKIIEIDGDQDTIYVFDKNAVQLYTRLYEMRDQYNSKALYMNYFLHTERLYALSPLFDGCYITLTAPVGA